MKKVFYEKQDKGITLIALVVTIVVLLILAGVSIQMLGGENGIIKQAVESKDKTKEANAKEKISVEVTGSYGIDGKIDISLLNENLNHIEGITHNGQSLTDNPITRLPSIVELDGIKVVINGNGSTSEPSALAELKESGETVTQKTTIKDYLGNTVVIPAGFKMAEDSGLSVIEGVVVEDDDVIGEGTGNQYVWVPVTKDENGDATAPYSATGTLADGTEIKLSRYTFDEDGNPTDEGDYDRIGAWNFGTPEWYTWPEEGLESFKLSVAENGGYYIARYEASYGTDGKANSKVSQTTSNDIDELEEGTLWNYITQTDSITASQNLYLETKSELINSYAYDTALLYIEKCSGNNSYARKIALNGTLLNTGESNDEVCKINDMAGNLGEWTTESATWRIGNGTKSGCVCRGARYSQPNYYASFRGEVSNTSNITYEVLPTETAEDIGFRVILYI